MKSTLKRLIAMLTLIAMVMTGATVTALAEELTDCMTDETIVESIPEDEEIVSCAVEETVDEADFALTEEGLSEATEEEIAEVEEMADVDLGELTGEAEAEPETTEETEEDRRQLMADLIDMAVEENTDKGLYAALNSTFATLADNADILANPETGVIETDGSEIVTMTYDALQNKFSVTIDQLTGAMGAAAKRADDAGYIQTLGGDETLVSIAAEEEESDQELEMAKDLMKDYFELGIDALSDAHPAFKALSPLLKGMLGIAFAKDEVDPLDQVNDKLDRIEEELKTIEKNLAHRMLNTVNLSDLGGEYGTVEKTMTVLKERIGNIQGRNISREEKLAELAKLYGTSLVTDLETAIVGATFAFEGQQNYTFDKTSIFDAAYNTACMDVMFSQEAIDRSAPYICRQFATYIAGYAVLETVYDACEATYGADYLRTTRDNMSIRLAGVDRNGRKVSKSMAELCADYFNRDRFIFVGKSNSTSIRLNQYMVVAQNIAKECKMDRDTMKTPDFMSNNPLSTKDVQMIADYCKEKQKSLFWYLLNEMEFEVLLRYHGKTYSRSDLWNDYFLKRECVVIPSPSPLSRNYSYNPGERSLDGKIVSKELPQKLYLATGKQSITQKEEYHSYGMGASSTNLWYYAQGINATDTCTGKDEKVQIMTRNRTTKTLERKDEAKDSNYYCSFMFFQAR